MTAPGEARSLPVAGQRSAPLGRSPSWAAAPSIAAAGIHGVASLVWVVAGEHLPGGRWLAVHLFTLGVLSNLVLTFSQHFAHAVTRAPGDAPRRDTALFNLGVVGILTGLPAARPWLVAAGATLATTAVLLGYLRLRRLRRSAVGARFAWIVRVYERAHGAFVHGAILGALLGTGLLPGTWYGTARIAHLHVNVLGWGGLTLLATLVFFGPTMTRTRIVDGADGAAARTLRWAATALTIGVLALLASAVGGAAGTGLRLVAATALAGFAAGATAVLLPVATAADRAAPTAARAPLLALCLWMVVALWADAVVIAAGAWRFLDALGLAVLLGVLLQSILATLTYLAPMLRGRSAPAREAIMARLAHRATMRAVVFNSGVFATVGATVFSVGGGDGARLARFGWALIIAVLVHLAVAALGPLPRR